MTSRIILGSDRIEGGGSRGSSNLKTVEGRFLKLSAVIEKAELITTTKMKIKKGERVKQQTTIIALIA